MIWTVLENYGDVILSTVMTDIYYTVSDWLIFIFMFSGQQIMYHYILSTIQKFLNMCLHNAILKGHHSDRFWVYNQHPVTGVENWA